MRSVKHLVTTLNWHSYNGRDNGGGLYGEIHELQKYVNNFTPPKQLVLTEWLARPAQPLAAAYPVIRDNGVAAYAWALIIVDCTSHWNRPVAPSDPPFQGMLWPNGSAYDDLEEGEWVLGWRNDCEATSQVPAQTLLSLYCKPHSSPMLNLLCIVPLMPDNIRI